MTGILINPYRFAAGAGGGGGFDPRSLAGLMAWYSAEAETGYADGANMTQWTDRSGNGNHAMAAGPSPTMPKWQASTGPGGGAAVRFPEATLSGGYFTLPSGLMTGLTAAEIFVSIKADPTQTVTNGFWSFNPFTGGNDGNYYPHSGVVYDSFGRASGSRQNFTPSLSITSWRRYNVWAAANDWAALLDETSQVSVASGTPTWATQPWLGRTRAAGAGAEAFKGWMSAVLLYDHKLTSAERSDVTAWLSANPSGGRP